MRAAVLGDVKPEIISSSNIECQFVVFSGTFADQDFPAVDIQGTETLGLSAGHGPATTIGLARVSFLVTGDFAGNRMPCVPIFDGLQSPGLFLDRCHPVADLAELLSDHGLS